MQININDIFINRKKELAEMEYGVKVGQKFVLIAPRRYGKTTLLKKLAERIANDNIQIIYIDIMKYSDNVISLAESITQALLEKAGIFSKIKNWIANLDTRLDLKIKLQEFEIDTIIQNIKDKDAYLSLDGSLQLVEKLAIKQNKRFVIIFDEIGELESLDSHAIKIMRSVIQHHKQVSYLFAGSQETIMKKIFINQTGPFYRFGQIYYLEELEINDVIEFFKDNIQNINTDVLDYIIKNFYGHPYYTTDIFYRISQKINMQPKIIIDMVQLKIIIQELLFSEKHYLEEQIKRIKLKKNHFNIFKQLVNEIFYGFSAPYVNKVLKDLESWGYIRKHAN